MIYVLLAFALYGLYCLIAMSIIAGCWLRATPPVPEPPAPIPQPTGD